MAGRFVCSILVLACAAYSATSAAPPAPSCMRTPVVVVRKYYQLWKWHRYQEMYAMLSSGYRAAHPYDQWSRTLGSPEQVAVDAKAGANASQVLVRVYTQSNDGTPAAYHGTWRTTPSGDSWLLDAPVLSRYATPPPDLLSAVFKAPSSTPVEQWLNDQTLLRALEATVRHPKAAAMAATDCFVDPSGRAKPTTGRDAGCSLIDGAGYEFQLGPAGPTRYQVLYDPSDRLVWFFRGCCSDFHQYLLSDVTAPPTCITDTMPLAQVRTKRGIRLGASIADVERAYGKAQPNTVGAYIELDYEYRPQAPPGMYCSTSFAFSKNRLAGIAMDGC
jgi:hypothetical protein